MFSVSNLPGKAKRPVASSPSELTCTHANVTGTGKIRRESRPYRRAASGNWLLPWRAATAPSHDRDARNARYAGGSPCAMRPLDIHRTGRNDVCAIAQMPRAVWNVTGCSMTIVRRI